MRIPTAETAAYKITAEDCNVKPHLPMLCVRLLFYSHSFRSEEVFCFILFFYKSGFGLFEIISLINPGNQPCNQISTLPWVVKT